MRSERLVSVDIGQSGSRVRSSDGLNFSGGPAFHQRDGVVASVERAIAAAGAPPADIVSLSLTGLRGDVPDPTEIGVRCRELTGARAVAVADDGYAAHVGALGGADGVVLTVGSGVAVVARCGERASHRDGDGPVLGDDGSGFWIGREGLRAAVRASEDRGPSTRLLEVIESAYGPLRTTIHTRSNVDAMRWCIDVARLVLQTAAESDPVAVAIREEAARRLAATAASAWRAVASPHDPVRYSYTGGVMADAHLRAALDEHLVALLPLAVLQPALGDNLDGALTIGRSPRHQIPPLLRWWTS